MKTINKIITVVNCKYGAPMGRKNVGQKIFDKNQQKEIPLTTKKIFDCRVKLDTGGYDRGGVYWGLGKELRVKYTKDLSYIEFYRNEN